MKATLSRIPGPIGVFDSGYGGLTILSKMREKLPQYDYIFLGDNARAPYGTRSFEVVYEFTLQAVGKLFEMGCQLVIIACNTASAKALRTIQTHDLPQIDPTRRVLGVIRPTVECIQELTKTRHIGVVGTEGTIKSESYPLEIHKLFPDITVSSQACPIWVPLVEYNEFAEEGADFFIKKYIDKLLEQDAEMDTIILGCTHYPLLLDKIKKNTPPDIQIVPQGELVADSLADYLRRHPEMEEKCTKNGSCTYYTTETAEKFQESASIFLNSTITVRHIELNNNLINNVDMEKDNKSKTVEVFKGSSWEAELVKGLLNSQNIDAMTKAGDLGAFSAVLKDDFTVLVKEEDKEMAEKIISEREANTEAPVEE